VGGGSVPNGTPHTLAHISLRWMIRECFKANTGIMFDAERLREIGLDAATLYPTVLARPPPLDASAKNVQVLRAPPLFKDIVYPEDAVRSFLSEEEHELRDAMSPIYDQLSRKKVWWAAEILPFKQPDKYRREIKRINLGRGRVIPDMQSGVKVHRSVKMRMEASQKKSNSKPYRPRAKVLESAIEWVD